MKVNYGFSRGSAKQKGSSGCPGNASSDDQLPPWLLWKHPPSFELPLLPPPPLLARKVGDGNSDEPPQPPCHVAAQLAGAFFEFSLLPINVLTGINKIENEAQKEKSVAEDPESKEVEMDDWLFEFAQLFRTHVGIDPDAHIDLHELGMELCSEALEETVTSEEAQGLFDKAAAKFQEVAALAFFNWGNVHMCAARKRIPLDESAGKEVVAAQLHVAYDWVKGRYSLAREKYEEALLIKPDFYEGLLALGQKQFEMAKLHWSFALAKKMDLSSWDSAETLKLFDSAEEKMKAATEMWEKLEEQRANELKDPSASKKEELLKRRKKQGSNAEGEPSSLGSQGEISADEAAEQAAVMRSQIHLFWGNVLFERSQVECKLGMGGWKENLDAAVERFKLAGASEADISTVLKNHCSNGDAVERDEKKVVIDEAKNEVVDQAQ
ncbi:protein CLMP1-like [Alnus glutinosa]|uniref:protein CLMP1-like n=1 Tax=Alnus glutinosa TaxID=3517 RepID=UPI002D784735|nr:protein CLMP1-like [Alnus glutinosa]